MDLYNHQQKIINDDPKKTGLWLGTGSGKSRIALLLARGETLVIVPKMQKEDGNWERELKKINRKLPLTVISKETFRRDHMILPKFQTVIIDEAHLVAGVTPYVRWRNKCPIPKASKLYEAVDEFLKRTQPERFYALTATPIRSPMVVFGLGKLLGKDWDFYEWRNTFYVRLPMPGREVFSPKSDRATKERLGRIVRSLGYTGKLSDYLDVPDQTYKTVYVTLTPEQKRRSADLELEFPDPIVLVGKKHQVENGILTGDEFNAEETFSNEKLDRLEEYALEFPRMIIFAKYRLQIRMIAEMMEKLGKKVFVLTGETKDRGALLATVVHSDEYVFIVQAQISAGWELPDCPVMIFASMSYSLTDRIQSEGRILRANKLKKNLYITLVARGGVDEAVLEAINNKQDFHEKMYENN